MSEPSHMKLLSVEKSAENCAELLHNIHVHKTVLLVKLCNYWRTTSLIAVRNSYPIILFLRGFSLQEFYFKLASAAVFRHSGSKTQALV